MSIRKFSPKVLLVGVLVALLFVMAIPSFAQATPEAYSSSTLLSSASDMVNEFNLMPFVIAGGIIGLVIYLVRRATKMVR